MRGTIALALSTLLGLALIQQPTIAQPALPIIDLHFHAIPSRNAGAAVAALDRNGSLWPEMAVPAQIVWH